MHRSLPLDYTTLKKKEKEKNNKEIDNGALFQLTKTKLTIFFFLFSFYPSNMETTTENNTKPLFCVECNDQEVNRMKVYFILY